MDPLSFSLAVVLFAGGVFLLAASRLYQDRATFDWAAAYLAAAAIQSLRSAPTGLPPALMDPAMDAALIGAVGLAALGTARHLHLPVARRHLGGVLAASVVVLLAAAPFEARHALYLMLFAAWMLAIGGAFLWHGMRRRSLPHSAIGAGFAIATAFEAAAPAYGDDPAFLVSRYALFSIPMLLTAVVLVGDGMARVKDRLARSEALYRTMFDDHAAPMYLIDPSGERVVAANRAAQRFYGWDEARFAGKPLAEFCDKGRLGPGSQDTPVIICRHRMADGSWRDVEMRSSPITLPDGRLLHFCIVHDVTERMALQRKLERMATTDALTGLWNRSRFLHEAEHEFARALRYGRPLALLMIDLDHFKRINDAHGHAVGDEALRHFAAVAGASLRASDSLGRLGGEEFAALLPETDLAAGWEVAERLRLAVASKPLSLANGEALIVTTSIGIAALDEGDANIDALVARADAALYEAKTGGRNRIIAAPPPAGGLSAGSGASR